MRETIADWKETTLGEIAEKVAMGPFGSNIKVETFVDSGVPIISGDHLRGLKLKDKHYNFITDEHAKRLKNSLVKRGDVIFTHAGNIGQVAYIPNNSKYETYIISQRQFFLRCDAERVIPEYITYFFKTRIGQYKLLANANQVGVPSIARPTSYLKSITIALPPLEDQKKIAGILGSLDDKIELLRKENETLEKLAQTLFKRWFVDFEFPADCALRNQAGRPISSTSPAKGGEGGSVKGYKSSGGKMIDSKLGPIPEGWRVGRLDDFVLVISGYAYGGDELVDSSNEALVTLKSFDRDGGFQIRGFKPFRGDPKPEHRVEIGDLVVAHTDLTQAADVLGNPAFIFSNGGFEKMYITMDLAKIVSQTSDIRIGFLYFLMKTHSFKRHCVGYSNGTTVLHMSRKAIPNYELSIPEDLALVRQFSDMAGVSLKKIIGNSSQIQTLSRLRDTLLPKLMSGEVKIG
ncbi:MAG: hypothetical protein HGB37_04235 [Candidatus Moranbacteria bacterium]|nr:hypothetical protein [Candidatus Moranbacteria bacterium]